MMLCRIADPTDGPPCYAILRWESDEDGVDKGYRREEHAFRLCKTGRKKWDWVKAGFEFILTDDYQYEDGALPQLSYLPPYPKDLKDPLFGRAYWTMDDADAAWTKSGRICREDGSGTYWRNKTNDL